MEMRFNINDVVKVKLTKFGLNYLAAEHSSSLHPREVAKMKDDILKKQDVDGYNEFQLYELMFVFGKFLYNGTTTLPFENNEIIIKIKDNELFRS